VASVFVNETGDRESSLSPSCNGGFGAHPLQWKNQDKQRKQPIQRTEWATANEWVKKQVVNEVNTRMQSSNQRKASAKVIMRGNEHHNLPSYMKNIFSMRCRFDNYHIVHSLSGQRLMGFGTLDDLRRRETSGEGREARSSEPEGWLSGSSDAPGTATASVRFKEVSVKLSQRSTVAWLLPELCSIHTSWGEKVSQLVSYSANEGHGAKFHVEIDVSRPSAQRINAKCGFALSNSTLPTRGSLVANKSLHKHGTRR